MQQFTRFLVFACLVLGWDVHIKTIYQGSTLFNRHLVTMPLIEPHMNIIVDRHLTLLSIPSLPFRTVPIFCYCLHVSLHSLVVFSSCLLHATYIVQFLMFAGFATFVLHSYNIHMTFLTLDWHFQYNQITSNNYSQTWTIQPTRLYPARDPKYFHAIRCYLCNHLSTYNYVLNVYLRTE